MRLLALAEQILGKAANKPSNGLASFSRCKWLVILVIAMMASVGAMAQLSGKGAISGTVTDKTGAVIPDATVVATNVATGIAATVKSSGAGDYTFTALDPGNYTVTTTAKGFEKLVQANIHVDAMDFMNYDPALTVGAADMEITVTDTPPQLETSNAALGSTMENEVYSELPIEMGAGGNADQRRATDFAALMPGVQGNETNGNATTNTGVVNGSGSKGAASAVYIDGMPFVRAGGNGDPRFVWTAISVDAVDQFNVQTTGFPAIYEGQGVMNYTIKAGGLKYHAALYDFIRNTVFDTWGFWKTNDPVTGLIVKPVEHNNEYGINLGGPLLPFGPLKEKLFFFGNYNGYRYTSANPTQMTVPTLAQQGGDFSALGVPIFDPTTQTACTNNSTNGPCRYQYGYGFSGTKGAGGGQSKTPTSTPNVIPASQFSAMALKLQSFLPTAGVGTAIQNNYIAPNPTGLVNWSTTERIDYNINSTDTLSILFADGRQASSVPVGQTTTGRNVASVPYNYGQAYAPKTIVAGIEEVHIFSPNLLNQFKWGYARYNGPTFNPNQSPTYAATAMGLTGLPTGQAQQTFPIVTFAGTGAPTNWGGTSANVTLAENYTLLDNLQWTKGKHSWTYGGQTAWLLYNVLSATGGTTPLTLATAVTETSNFVGKAGSFSIAPSEGSSYASFLIGQIDKASFTQYLQSELGTRFRAISGYVQDNYKATSKLTLDLGVRYDFFPSLREVHDAQSYFDPNLANPVTGINGALNFAGTGTGTCNCDSPVRNSHYSNIGPRLGAAYQLGSKTVIRSSYGIMYTHGDGVGGLATSLGTLGFSAAPSFAGSQGSAGLDLSGSKNAIPAFAPAAGVASGPAYGTGYFSSSANPTANSGTPSSMGYADPYLGSRAPQYINWTFGVQRQLTKALALTATYVGSEGHFLQTDGGNPRGYNSNGLDPKYLMYGTALGDSGATRTADCINLALPCAANVVSTQALSTALKPFPFQTVTDTFAYVANAHYHGLQAMINMRAWHGLTLNSNFTWSRAIDNGGTFRTGYAIPAGTVANNSSASYKADAIERTVSTSNQPLHFVATAVWNWPLGRTVLNSSNLERAILGGFKFSSIFQAYSGSPLVLTGSSCQTNPAQNSTCQPIMNPGFSGSARQNGKWGKGTTYNGGANNPSYIVPSTGYLAGYVAGSAAGTPTSVAGPFINPTPPTTPVTTPATTPYATLLNNYAYKFSDAPRTAPYGLNGPGNYQLDLAMVRSFKLHLTETSKFNIRGEWYNVTNHTLFGIASQAVGNSSFGQATNNAASTRKAAQFSARLEF